MNGQTVYQALVEWSPWIVIGVAATSVASAVAAFGVLLVTQLLGPKTEDHHGGAHGHHPH